MKKVITYSLLTICLFAQAQDQVHFNQAQSLYSNGTEAANQLVVDADHNIYTIGNFGNNDSIDCDPGLDEYMLHAVGITDTYITKWNMDGQFLWAKQLAGTDATVDGRNIAVDEMGNVYCSGIFLSTIDFDPSNDVANASTLSTTGEVFIIKLNADGEYIWHKQFVGGEYDMSYTNSMVLDNDDNPVLLGNYWGHVDFDPAADSTFLYGLDFMREIFIVKLNPQGDLLWAKSLHSGVSSPAYDGCVRIADSGNMYITGYFWGTVDFDPGEGIYGVTSEFSYQGFVLKLDALGNFVWASIIGGSGRDSIYSLAIDDDENIFYNGSFEGDQYLDFDPHAIGTYNLAIANGVETFCIGSLNAIGEYRWARLVGTGLSWDYANTLATDLSGHVYLADAFSGTMDADFGADVHTISASSILDAFVIKMNTDGDFIWAKQIGGDVNAAAAVNAIYVNENYDIHLAGGYFNTMDFDFSNDEFEMTSLNGNQDVFVSKWTQCFHSNSVLEIAACETYTSPSGMYTWTISGTYQDTIPNISGCDSLITINLVINQPAIAAQSIAMCFGEMLQIGDSTYTMSGTYTNILETTNGCDSTLTTTLMVADEIEIDMVVSAASNIFCTSGSTIITVDNSQPNHYYSLRNDADNSIVDGQIEGTENPIVFDTGVLNATTSFNILSQPFTPNAALSFDGVDEYVQINQVFPLTNYTYQVWFKTTTASCGISCVTDPTLGGANDRALYLNNGDLKFYVYDNISNTIISTSGTNYADGNWHHVATVLESGVGQKIYVDGALAANGNATNQSAFNWQTSFDLGFSQINGQKYFSGQLDGATLWNEVRSAAQIQEDMNHQFDGDENNLIFHYNMNEDMGNTIGNISNATPTGNMINMEAADWANGAVVLAECSAQLSQTVSIEIKATSMLNMSVEVCESYTSPSGFYTWTESGIYMDTIPNFVGCDSVLTIDLIINHATMIEQDIHLCGGESFAIANDILTESGTYMHVFEATNGCDSIVTTHLTIEDVIDVSLNLTASENILCDSGGVAIMVEASEPNKLYCLRNGDDNSLVATPIQGTGGTLVFDTGIINESTTYNVLVKNNTPSGALTFDGVDEYVQMNQVFPLTNYTYQLWFKTTTQTCGISTCTQPTLGGANDRALYLNNGDLKFYVYDNISNAIISTTGTNYADGTWHHVTTVLEFGVGQKIYVDGELAASGNTTDHSEFNWQTSFDLGFAQIPSGHYFNGQIDAVTLWNEVHNEAQIQQDMNHAFTGDENNLIFHYNMNEDMGNIISGALETSPIGNLINFEEEDWTVGISQTSDCEAQLTQEIFVMIVNTTSSELTVSSCNSYNSPSGLYQWSESGIYADTIANVNGCDSVITIYLTINNMSNTNIDLIACGSYTLDAETYTVSGIYSQLLTNVAGCDSLITLNLTITEATSTAINETACASFTLNAETYNESGIYSQMLTNAAGCDSLITLNLTITEATSTAINETACASFTLNNETYTESGIYSQIHTNAVGCDSLITLNLTITEATSTAINETACASFILNAETYNESGIYSQILTNVAGCDSLITLNLTILNASMFEQDITICAGETFVVGDSEYNTTGIYTDLLVAQNGCDSIATTNLVVSDEIDISISVNEATATANQSGATYQWMDCDNNNMPIEGENDQVFNAPINGNFAVLITIDNCTSMSDCAEINWWSVAEMSAPFSVALYPNPSSGIFKIRSAITPDHIVITDMLGQQIFSITPTSSTTVVDLKQEASGIYLLRARKGTSEFVQKIILSE